MFVIRKLITAINFLSRIFPVPVSKAIELWMSPRDTSAANLSTLLRYTMSLIKYYNYWIRFTRERRSIACWKRNAFKSYSIPREMFRIEKTLVWCAITEGLFVFNNISLLNVFYLIDIYSRRFLANQLLKKRFRTENSEEGIKILLPR